MKNLSEACFICGGKDFADSSRDYSRCGTCGLETIKRDTAAEAIVSDMLILENIRKRNLLDSFQKRVLEECAVTKDLLLDIGSGSGRFLYHNGPKFQDAVGIEISHECAYFAREKLGLKIEEDITNLNSVVSAATFWHSLEHMTRVDIERSLNRLNMKSSFDTRLIISFPNNNSLQYLLFGEGFAYYDKESHIHQFSLRSLDRLMGKYRFERLRFFYSFPYSIFGWLQGFINKFNPIHDYLYYRRKRGETFDKSEHELFLLDAYNFLLALFFSMPAALLSLTDLVCPERGGVITTCYRRKKE